MLIVKNLHNIPVWSRIMARIEILAAAPLIFGFWYDHAKLPGIISSFSYFRYLRRLLTNPARKYYDSLWKGSAAAAYRSVSPASLPTDTH